MSKANIKIALLFLAILLPFLTFSEFYFLNIALSATGVPKILNYQGRLLNSSGSLLGGTSGTIYCFKFSFYSDATVGSPDTKLWPTNDPSITTSTVKDGVFNVAVGDTSAGGDTLDFDFQNTDSIYLNVEVAAQVGGSCSGVSFENLAPRQRIYSSGYSINALTVGGYTPAQSASSSQIPVLTNGNLILGGDNPQILSTGINVLNIGTTTSNVAIAGLNCSGYSSGGTLTTNASGTIICAPDDTGAAGSGITTLNGLDVTVQLFATSTNYGGFTISSAGSTHTFNFPGRLNDINNVATTTGSLLVASTTWKGLTPGTNGKVLITSSTAPLGLSWESIVNSLSSGTGISISSATGNPTITNIGVQSLTAGTGISISSATGTPTITNIQPHVTSTINGVTTNTFTFASSTTGTDFTISTTTNQITFNMPSASASNRGLLTSTDWGTFNTKQSTITLSTSTSYSYNVFTISSTSPTWTFNIPQDWNDIAALSTSTGNLMVASSTGWKALGVGANGKVLMASSTAQNGISWETVVGGSGISSLNGLTETIQTFATSTTGLSFSIVSSGSTHTFNFPYRLNQINNLATTTGNIIVGTSSPSGWVAFPAGADGKVLTASSTSPYGISWEVASSTGGSGITSLNGLIGSSQLFASSTNGTDFSISSAGSTHTFNLPSATSTTRGLLTSADWTAFSGKENALTFSTGLNRVGNIITNTGVLSLTSDNYLGVSSATGTITLTSRGVNSLTAGTGISISSATGTPTITNSQPHVTSTINGVTTNTFTFASSTTGTDFTISTTTNQITFNLPSASAANRGLLTLTDWGTFNTKQSAITLSTSTSYGYNVFTISSSSPTWIFNIPQDWNDIAALSTSTGNLMVASSTGWKALSAGTNGKVLMASSTASTGLSWETINANPGGSNTQIQFNNNGLFAGDSNFTWASSTQAFTITGTSTLSGKLMVNTTATTTGQLNLVGSTGLALGVAGLYQESTLNPSASGSFQFGNRHIISIAPTASSTMIGEFVKAVDNTSLNNIVRAMEVQAAGGTNVYGINTGIFAAGRTFGIQAVTDGSAGGVVQPAAIFAENTTSTQGQIMRLYSQTMASSSQDFAQFYQEVSDFKGTGLKMDFARSGSFTGNFVNFINNQTSKFVVNATGTLMIGTSTPYGVSNMVICAQSNCVLPGATSTVAVFASDDGTTSGRSIAAHGSITGSVADFGEYVSIIGSTQDYEYGDLLSVDTSTSTLFIKSSKPYDSQLAGVITKSSAFVAGGEIADKENSVIMALAGRVPVKVSGENGSITTGDLITASSKSGFGMKATNSGRVVGMALESFDSATSTDEGKIMVFVNPHWAGLSDVEFLQGGKVGTGETLNTYTFDPKYIYAFENLKVQNLEIGSAEEPSGITIYDKSTKQPYCIVMEAGVLKSISGKCDDNTLIDTNNNESLINTNNNEPLINTNIESVVETSTSDTTPSDSAAPADTFVIPSDSEESQPTDTTSSDNTSLFVIPSGSEESQPAGTATSDVGNTELAPATETPTEIPATEPIAESTEPQ